jgi:hypothetical protein
MRVQRRLIVLKWVLGAGEGGAEGTRGAAAAPAVVAVAPAPEAAARKGHKGTAHNVF